MARKPIRKEDSDPAFQKTSKYLHHLEKTRELFLQATIQGDRP